MTGCVIIVPHKLPSGLVSFILYPHLLPGRSCFCLSVILRLEDNEDSNIFFRITDVLSDSSGYITLTISPDRFISKKKLKSRFK